MKTADDRIHDALLDLMCEGEGSAEDDISAMEDFDVSDFERGDFGDANFEDVKGEAEHLAEDMRVGFEEGRDHYEC